MTYLPTFQDALKIFWSFTWRSIAISIIVVLPLTLLVLLTGIIPFPFDVDDNHRTIFLYTTPLSKALFQSVIFMIQLMVGTFAFKDLVKAKYATFLFHQNQISLKNIMGFVFILNGFETLFSFFALPKIQSLGAFSLFTLIRIFVSCALLQHVMSTGFFKGFWKIHLPLVEREEKSSF